MLYYPKIKQNRTSQQVIDVFGGYHHAPRIAEGEFYNMQNLTSDDYPMLAARKKRGKLRSLTDVAGMLGGDKLVFVDGETLYYDGTAVAGITLSDDDGMRPKRMVRMGAYLCIFPDKVYLNTVDLTDCGSMEAQFSAQQEITYSLCKRDGSEFDSTPTVSAQPPATPTHKAYWVDTGAYPHVLKQYVDGTGWLAVPEVFVKLTLTGIGAPFQVGDGVVIDGLTDPTDPAQHWRASDLPNGNRMITACAANYIVVSGMIDETYAAQTPEVTVKRAVPDMDFVVECQNRLWGCKYGEVDGEMLNELYCCALGDFKNWARYQGISTDSWRASCGTDGEFTGAITFGGNPIFFKKNALHKIYVSAAGAHNVAQTACTGPNEHDSLAIVGSTLFYMSDSGVMAYDGSLPQAVGEVLGETLYAVCAAAYGQKYYLCVQDTQAERHLFVLDTTKGLWHREDDKQFRFMAVSDSRLFAIESTADGDALYCLSDAEYAPVTEAESAVQWFAESGLIGYRTVERKYVSHFNIRMQLPVGASADLWLEYDSGTWEHVGHFIGKGTNSFLLPVRPRRCDHFRWKLSGSGEVRVYSVAKILEQGSDER